MTNWTNPNQLLTEEVNVGVKEQKKGKIEKENAKKPWSEGKTYF